MRGQRIFWMVLVCVFSGIGIGSAQVTTGTIVGTVMDSTGAVVPAATVTVRNLETGISRTQTTDSAGRYRAPQLPLGNYDVTTEAAGFQTVVRSGITLTVGREAAVDFTLQVGAVSERITVTGEAPLVQTSNATVASLVDERAMRELPLNGRSFADLTGIQPGVISDMQMTAAPTQAVYTGGGSPARRPTQLVKITRHRAGPRAAPAAYPPCRKVPAAGIPGDPRRSPARRPPPARAWPTGDPPRPPGDHA